MKKDSDENYISSLGLHYVIFQLFFIQAIEVVSNSFYDYQETELQCDLGPEIIMFAVLERNQKIQIEVVLVVWPILDRFHQLPKL